MEMWKDMPGFEEYYEISSKGNARSKERIYINKSGRKITKHSKELKPIIGESYIRYGLKIPNDTKVYKVLAHRMVAMAFIENIDNLPDVGHLDDNGFNNDISNLYWTSKSDNMRKAVDSNRLTFDMIKESNSIPVYLISENETLLMKSCTEAAKFLLCTTANVYDAIKNNRKISGYNILRVKEKNAEGEINYNSDTVENSAVTAIRVLIVAPDGRKIYANSISSAAKKLNRSIMSVMHALENGSKCNGCKVYKIEV
jgi:hypothetical protein